MNSKSEYLAYCDKNEVPFFNQPWWLEIVSHGKWECVMMKKKELLLGFLPYVQIQKFKLKGIGLPLLTQFINPILIYPNNQKYAKRLGFEKDVLQGLYQQLPKVSFVSQTWGHTLTNWLPLHWLGYKQTSRFSYTIREIKDHETVHSNFETKIRGDIRKAEKLVQVEITKDASIIYDLVSKTFERKSIAMPYTQDLFAKIVEGSIDRNCGEVMYAIDRESNIHAAIFVVWDHESAYYLLGGGDTDYRNSGATSLLLYNAIKKVSAKVDRFDFEGSMMEPIERFVRGFGSKQIELKVISKSTSKRFFMIQTLKEFKKLF
jgi:hypothetical protein